jgi:regulator of sirC expression with transglutaminase-like and TPR domain
MWESVLKKELWELQVNSDSKSIRLQVSNNPQSQEQVTVQWEQSELFELLHAFLTINRSFNNEPMYYDDKRELPPIA